jgi:predicted peptidase
MVTELHGLHDECLPYLLFSPPASEHPRPVIVFLHGRDERRKGTESQAELLEGRSLHKLRGHGLCKLASQHRLPEIRGEDFPFLLLCPQTEEWWQPHAQRIDALINDLVRERGADPQRCYLTGISMGGYGSWLVAAELPHRFAALVPISAKVPSHAAGALRDTPAWVFLGVHDMHVNREDVIRELVSSRPPSPRTVVTVDATAAHDEEFWAGIYKQSLVYDWLLSQHKSSAP